MADQSYLILGASGLIGGHLYRRLVRRESASVVWGTCHTRRRNDLVPYDLAKGGWPVPQARGPGILFVCGAMMGLSHVFENPALARDINVDQTQRVISEAHSRGFRTVFLSTDKVYGHGAPPFREEQAGDPTTLYGRLKWEAETWLRTHHGDALIVRLSKVYGTDADDESVVQEMSRTLRAGQSLTCCPDLLCQPTHVEDVVAGILHLVETGATGAWNLAHPQVWSRLDFGVAVCRRLGASETLIRSLPVSALPLQEPHPPDGRLDVSRFFHLYPQPFVPLDEGIARLDPRRS